MASSHDVERYDSTQYYSLKGVIERLLGKRAYAEIKESRSVGAWRRHALRLLKASGLAVEVTVKVCDSAWRRDVASLLAMGERRIRSAESVEDVIATLASTYLELSFLQLGLVPKHTLARQVRMRGPDWRLDSIRSVQYVQTAEQREAEAWGEIQREVGVARSLELHREWKIARLDVPFSEWYRAREPQDADRSC